MKASSSAALRTAAQQVAHSRRQEKILEKAVLLFAAHGYADTDTQFLADQLQVGKGTLYRYFRSKEELFLAAVDFGMQKLHESVCAAVDLAVGPMDRIRQGVRGYLAFFVEHPEIVELMIQERAIFRDQRKSTYFQRHNEFAKQWQELYRQLIAEGLLRDMPPERISNIVSQLLYGAMFTNFFSGRRPDFESQAADIMDVVLDGILSDSQRQRRRAADTGAAGHHAAVGGPRSAESSGPSTATSQGL
ncbi:MAG: TetR/AcrR family transcriptional regulator [Thermoguttaceae bacterium]